MKNVAGALFILLFIVFSHSYADNTVTVTGADSNISDNLDLNRDGQVDYLRVVETVEGDTHLVTLQAVIGEKRFQDVATIRLEKNNNKEVTVQIIGAAEIYGDDYIIEPTYTTPLIFPLLFRAGHYRPWFSPFRWGHYPHHYRPWSPYPLALYRSNIQIQINSGDTSHQFKRSRGSITTTTPKTGKTQPLQQAAPHSRSYSTRPADLREKEPGHNRVLATSPNQTPRQKNQFSVPLQKPQ